ncbi:DUF1707 SHOCT-like domain-containing protein [Rhizohabitans arisaemae]|uniref:DUF1707 SHOCT-like domain-containing protein n=1 Tax=Rhizohabitans arisaemae TaxID=2720610 RepID=UPI0024B116CA|nr:DUF1707 domain-containing protein [Rhizohabitans arisaemae]
MIPADRHDDLRVGDAERDAVVAALQEHFAQGRLTADELDERVAATLSAKTAGALREITRDLPGPEQAPHRPEHPIHRAQVPHRRPGGTGRHRGAPWLILLILFVIGVSAGFKGLLILGVIAAVVRLAAHRRHMRPGGPCRRLGSRPHLT